MDVTEVIVTTVIMDGVIGMDMVTGAGVPGAGVGGLVGVLDTGHGAHGGSGPMTVAV